ncbi:hypothetical protein AGLY_002339 [Aphis glycines]|uniref:Uncharacterized protein n=1 Tax=Aphis glycines TaxID=307491 RepID=A0A6G0U4I9_APHGL|nr:hypothetical protein AGLY_002339 [Aphis glycines]
MFSAAYLFLDSERSDECIDFTMIITSRNNASISNFGGGFRWKSEYPWCIIEEINLENKNTLYYFGYIFPADKTAVYYTHIFKCTTCLKCVAMKLVSSVDIFSVLIKIKCCINAFCCVISSSFLSDRILNEELMANYYNTLRTKKRSSIVNDAPERHMFDVHLIIGDNSRPVETVNTMLEYYLLGLPTVLILRFQMVKYNQLTSLINLKHATSFSSSVIALRSYLIYVEFEVNLRLVCAIHQLYSNGNETQKKISSNTRRLSALFSTTEFKRFTILVGGYLIGRHEFKNFSKIQTWC